MRPASAFRPSSVSRVLNARRVCRRCLSQQANRSVAQLLQWRPTEKADDVVINGFVRSVRSMKAHRFVALGDGSSLAPLQALVQADYAEGLTVGAAVRLTGAWVASPGAAQSHELHVNKVEVLGPSDAKTFPIQKKYQTPEYLRTMPHLRPRTPLNAVLLKLRSDSIASLTQFFAGRSFTQTHPPILTSSDCEGAGEVFTVAPASDAAGPADQDGPGSFFRSKKYLTVSTQLHLEALAQGVGNVWTLSPVFRAEESDTSRHLSEFYMLEAEMSFVDGLAPVMDLAEDMLRSLSTNLYGTATVQDLLSRSRHSGSDLAPAEDVRRRWEGLMQKDWPRMTYSDAVALLQQRADLFAHKPTWGAGLQSEHEKYLADYVGGGEKPVFITNYPRDIKAFYMLESQAASSNGQQLPGATVDCFDLLVPEFCEIAGGSMREHRLGPLLDAMKRQGIVGQQSEAGAETPSVNGLDWYVDLRRWGCPPHGGFGLGFDRLLSYLSGVQTVRDMVSFPRWFGRCDC
ncbi:asparaginyl-tRNA synthetase [Trichocladium antarcticum]|uniref:asparagine--tRNA ligase n=1 Tax=Trichocladium antarcticum TaxID=1450529 RepID=A0AAN6ZB19_9PEZI|nr:asparaginyl-tRNA synthetase [Trichocladium antarcticum]